MEGLTFWQWIGTGAIFGSIITFLGVAFRAALIRKTEREKIELEKEVAARKEFREDFNAVTQGMAGQIAVLTEHQEGLQLALNSAREQLRECLERCAACEAREVEWESRIKSLENGKTANS